MRKITDKPLKNRKIVITRAAEQADDFADILSRLGAIPVRIPVIEIQPLESPELREALLKANSYSWIIFTSSNGAAIFLEKLRGLMDPAMLAARICAIGPGTSGQIEKMGFTVHLVPKIFQAEGILEEFSKELAGSSNGMKVLIPRALQAREILPESLIKMGMEVDVIPVYQTVFPSGKVQELRDLLRSSSPDLITFTSSSTVTNFIRLAGDTFDIHSCLYASIGPVTSETAEKEGISIAVNAEESTLESLAEAIADFFSGTNPPDPGGD